MKLNLREKKERKVNLGNAKVNREKREKISFDKIESKVNLKRKVESKVDIEKTDIVWAEAGL